MTIKQAMSIPTGIDPAPFWAYFFLYSSEETYMSSLISFDKIQARHFHSTKRFIDDFCVINDVGKFERCIFNTYHKELEIKVEHQGDHVTFLNFDITIKEGTLIYKLFDKRDSFYFSLVRMPHIESKIPQNIFY